MAAHERLSSHISNPRLGLLERLATVLPQGSSFKVYHVSTPPTVTSALYSAPPGEKPEKTFCESHFLAISIKTLEGKEVIVFAIEVLIYSTSASTTIFVSKADSSGYIHHLAIPKGSVSSLKVICSTFLAYLVQHRQRAGIRTIVSLFARAQDQYLFPGSIENGGKHVLDDRGLVKWWCRVLSPLVQGSQETSKEGAWQSVHGYLTIPGLEKYDTKSFLPAGDKADTWDIGHPLREISLYSKDAPPRCFIPHFPDDPKARFLDTLDDELSDSQGQTSGQWKSVRSLEAFWEMMAFRQECAAGRLVGFIWVVFNPVIQLNVAKTAFDSQESNVTTVSEFYGDGFKTNISKIQGPRTPKTEHRARPRSQKSSRFAKMTKKKPSGPIIARQARVKTINRANSGEQPERSAYYIWPTDSRGHAVLDKKDYKRMEELLLSLDFANLELAVEGTRRWINEVRSVASRDMQGWGSSVVGLKVPEQQSETVKAGVSVLNMGLVRKKRKGGPEADGAENAPEDPQVNVLPIGMLRKKVKS